MTSWERSQGEKKEWALYFSIFNATFPPAFWTRALQFLFHTESCRLWRNATKCCVRCSRHREANLCSLSVSEMDDLYPSSTPIAWAPIHVGRDLLYKRRSSHKRLFHHSLSPANPRRQRVPSSAPGLRTPSGQLLPRPPPSVNSLSPKLLPCSNLRHSLCKLLCGRDGSWCIF